MTVGQIGSNTLSFLRNIIIARLLSPADYGIAALFSLTISFLEMVSNLSAENLLVQADFGDETRFEGMVHYVQIVRGVFASVIILLTGGLIARVFSVPEAGWAFRTIAAVPLIRGFVHRDINRFQREFKFVPYLVTENAAGMVATLAAIPICLVLRNFTAALWILILHSLMIMLVSHIVSKRKFIFRPEWEYGKEIFRFGWPLLFNGIFLFLIFQGDRFVIASAKQFFPGAGYSLEVLGWYSAAFSISLVPSLMIMRICSSVFLPALSEVKNEDDLFIGRYRGAFALTSLAIGMFVLPFVLGGGHTINIVFGEKYIKAVSVIGIFGIMQGVRLLKVIPTTAAMAKGDTKNAMYSNIFRMIGFLGVIFSAYLRLEPFWIAIWGLIGEGMGTFASIYRIGIIHKIPISISFFPASVLIGVSFLGLYGKKFVDHPNSLFSFIILLGILYLLMFVGLFLTRRKNGIYPHFDKK